MRNRRRLLIMAMGGFRWIYVKLVPVVTRKAELDAPPTKDFEIFKMESATRSATINPTQASDMIVESAEMPYPDANIQGADAEVIRSKRVVRLKRNIDILGYLIGQIHLARSIVTIVSARVSTASTQLLKINRKAAGKSNAKLNRVDTILSCVDLSENAELSASLIEADAKTVYWSREAAIVNDMALTPADTSTLLGQETNTSMLRSDLVSWIYPDVDENGVMTLRQVYSATQTGDILEVM